MIYKSRNGIGIRVILITLFFFFMLTDAKVTMGKLARKCKNQYWQILPVYVPFNDKMRAFLRKKYSEFVGNSLSMQLTEAIRWVKVVDRQSNQSQHLEWEATERLESQETPEWTNINFTNYYFTMHFEEPVRFLKELLYLGFEGFDYEVYGVEEIEQANQSAIEKINKIVYRKKVEVICWFIVAFLMIAIWLCIYFQNKLGHWVAKKFKHPGIDEAMFWGYTFMAILMFGAIICIICQIFLQTKACRNLIEDINSEKKSLMDSLILPIE